MSSRFLLTSIKCSRRDILITRGPKRFFSQHIFRKWDRNNMLLGSGDRKAQCLSLERNKSYANPAGSPGSGAGKGGGAGGTVRESGGGLGQYGAAQEEQFFFNKQREQLKALKKKMLERKNMSQKKEK